MNGNDNTQKIKMTYTISVIYDPYDFHERDDDPEQNIESIASMDEEIAMEDPEEFFNTYKRSSEVEVEEKIRYKIIK